MLRGHLVDEVSLQHIGQVETCSQLLCQSAFACMQYDQYFVCIIGRDGIVLATDKTKSRN